jgi:hypothetical protein
MDIAHRSAAESSSVDATLFGAGADFRHVGMSETTLTRRNIDADIVAP